MALNSKIEPTYSLKSIEISNFKGIKEIHLKNLPREASWIFLTGENGYGKTSILQAISLGLYFNDDQKAERSIRLKDYFTGKGVIKPGIHSNAEPFSFNEARQILKKRGLNVKGFPFLTCYGSSRLDTYSESSNVDILSDTTYNLFDSTSLLQNIELQLSRWYFKREDPEFREKYDYVTKLLIEILGIKKITIDKKTDEVLYTEQDEEGHPYQSLPARHLAAGYRSLISMIGDMILRLFELQPKITDPSKLEGIIIIDELDLHFHPKWQKKLPGLLSNCFPKIQFIASTHSPIPLLGAPKRSVFLTVNRSAEEGISLERLVHLEQELPKLTPNLLLDSPIFGYADLFSSQAEPDVPVYTETSHAEISLNEQIQKDLESKLSPKKREELRKLLKKG